MSRWMLSAFRELLINLIKIIWSCKFSASRGGLYFEIKLQVVQAVSPALYGNVTFAQKGFELHHFQLLTVHAFSSKHKQFLMQLKKLLSKYDISVKFWRNRRFLTFSKHYILRSNTKIQIDGDICVLIFIGSICLETLIPQ